MKGYPNVKTYPPWTVDRCICSIGHYRPDCPYAKHEFLFPQIDMYNDLLSKKVDNTEEKENTVVE